MASRIGFRDISTCFPDSSTILQLVFEEPEFARKTDFFCKTLDSHKIPVEILPWVGREVHGRLAAAGQEFIRLLSSVSSTAQSIASKDPKDVRLDDNCVELLGRTMDQVCAIIRRQYASSERRYRSAMARARVIEMFLVQKIYDQMDATPARSLKDMINEARNEFGEQYVKYSNKLDDVMRRIGAARISDTDFPQSADRVRRSLSSLVKNPGDVEILCQATSRMIHVNRWGALVTVDYSDMVQNREKIEGEVLLVVCDPLYLLSRLRQKAGLNALPSEQIRRRGLSQTDFIVSPTPTGVV